MNNGKKLLAVPVAAGFAAAVLRELLYRFALDDKGLLRAHHPLSFALLALTVFTVAAVLLFVKKQQPETNPDRFGRILAAVGSAVLALGIAFPGGTAVSQMEALNTVYLAVRWLAVASMLAAAVCRLLDKSPSFLLYGAACLFFSVHMVMRYQAWSSHPQMLDYAYVLMAGIFLDLFAYYNAAAEAGVRKPGMRLGCGLLAWYFCCAALPRGEFVLLYAAGAVWALTNLNEVSSVKKDAPEERG